MSQSAIDRWERRFRAAAKADKYTILRDHLRRLEQPESPKLLLEGTILAVRACSCYYALDQRNDEEFDLFLDMQRYNPADAIDARYAFTFDLWGKGFARVLVETKAGTLDLADLYGHPWWDYKSVGYSSFWISRTDWGVLMEEELRELEDEVTSDLRYDYREDELDFWFNDQVDETFLYVIVQDVFDSEEEEDEDEDPKEVKRKKSAKTNPNKGHTMQFTDDQAAKIANLINKGEKFHVIAKKVGGGCTWQDIQSFCWQTGEMSWQGSKRMISSRLNKFPNASTRPERVRLAREIAERVNYLYQCAKNMKGRLDAFEKAAAKLIEIS